MSSKVKNFKNKQFLVAAIGDEPTITGMLLTGMGERNKNGETNYLIVDKDTSVTEIENTFIRFTQSVNIGVILINQHIAEDIRQTINNHDEIIPTILEIPSKDIKYDPEKDSIMQRAAKQLYGGDAGQLKLDDD